MSSMVFVRYQRTKSLMWPVNTDQTAWICRLSWVLLGAHHLSQLMRLWYYLSSVNSFFKHALGSHPVGLDVWFLVSPFVYFHTFCVRTAKALVRLRGCAGSPEPSLVAYVISTKNSWASSFGMFCSALAHIMSILEFLVMEYICVWNYLSFYHYSKILKILIPETI